MNETTRRVLEALLANEPRSGEEIARKLSISRAAIWKHITELRSHGYEIESSPGKGYTLATVPDTLHEAIVHRYLKPKVLGREVIFLESCGSTNSELKTLAEKGASEGVVVVTNEQIAGRGRRGRTWVANKGEALLFSVLLRPELPPAELSGLTLVTGVAVVEALLSLGISTSLKWPNDVHLDGKKVCGILAEASGEIDHTNYVILGIGINVSGHPHNTEYQSTSLAGVDAHYPRAQVLAHILESLEDHYRIFLEGRVAEILDKWRRYTNTLGKKVDAHTSSGSFSGVARDITPEGSLIITLESGEERIVSAGDVSIR